MKRLTIVAPYRARESHLEKWVPALRAYFARDKLDREIPYRVLVIEQDTGLPFNRGALKNIGFLLGRNDGDYTCFHDIDYFPIWADYSWSDLPAAIVWYGAEWRPIAPGRSNAKVLHNLDEFFGAAVLISNAMFAQVNGYANSYWGWGSEDNDLKHRLKSAGIALSRRKGTFQPMDHDNEGFQLDASPSAINIVNRQIFQNRWAPGANTCMQEDGLNNVAYEILNRSNIPEGPEVERPACWEKVTVRLRMLPRREQLEAIARTTRREQFEAILDRAR
jgi:hypothetical protein